MEGLACKSARLQQEPHFGLRQDQAHKVLSLRSLADINRQLHKIQLRVVNNELENIGAYTAKLFGVS